MNQLISPMPAFRTSPVSPVLVAAPAREKRPRIAPGDFVRCASTSAESKDLLRQVSRTMKDRAPQPRAQTQLMAAPVAVTDVIPQPIAIVIPRGRPSKIAVASRARLLGPEDELVEVSLIKSRNYDQFIIPTGLALPTEAEVQRMMDLISLRNGLAWNPMRVTPYLEVYDGKIRLEAARRLNLELTYLVDEQLTVGDIIQDRGDARGWEFDQYCLYYAEQGRGEYKRLLDFAKENDLPLGAAASLLAGGKAEAPKTEVVLTDFKRGRFRVTSEAHAKQVVAIRNEYRQKFGKASTAPKKDPTKQRVFLNVVSHTLALPEVDQAQIQQILPQIRWQPTEADYDRHLNRLLRDARKPAEVE
jgi:hypothetical protein